MERTACKPGVSLPKVAPRFSDEGQQALFNRVREFLIDDLASIVAKYQAPAREPGPQQTQRVIDAKSHPYERGQVIDQVRRWSKINQALVPAVLDFAVAHENPVPVGVRRMDAKDETILVTVNLAQAMTASGENAAGIDPADEVTYEYPPPLAPDLGYTVKNVDLIHFVLYGKDQQQLEANGVAATGGWARDPSVRPRLADIDLP